MTEQELLIDSIRRLNRLPVAYMVTGSLASNHWGIPRSTHDLDFVIQFPPQAVSELVKAFEDDFYIDADMVRSAFQPPFQFNAIDTRSALKLDFWLLKPEPFDREAFSRRIERVIFGERAWLATAEDVILSKLIWHSVSPSDKQLGDVAGVIAVQGDGLDKNYLRGWGRTLGFAELLERLFAGEIRPKTS